MEVVEVEDVSGGGEAAGCAELREEVTERVLAGADADRHRVDQRALREGEVRGGRLERGGPAGQGTRGFGPPARLMR
jgi:hypothetical protein